MRWEVLAAFTVAAAAAFAMRRNAAQEADAFEAPDFGTWGSDPEPYDQRTDLLDDLIVTLDPRNSLPVSVDADTADRNVRAFLDVIAHAEGADYNTLFGGGTFSSYADHPRQFLTFPMGGRSITSSAAGRYQFLARTWDGLKVKLGLPDFSPASQDRGAIELIRERGALRDVQDGRFAVAVDKVRKVWASLPGAGYGQPERNLTTLQAVYTRAGGSFA